MITRSPQPAAADPVVRAVEANPVMAVAIGAGAVLVLGIAVAGWRRSRGRVAADQALTLVAAGIATAVAAQGMWRFFGDVLQLAGPLRVMMFAFIEVAVLSSAVRARRSMRERHTAGVDGLAVWVLTCLSAVLSSLDSRSFGEAVFRLAAPLVAAWLWERGMAIERIRLTGRARINWKLTPERIFVRLGLADPTDRTAGEADTDRRLLRLALAAKRARDLRNSTGPLRRLPRRRAMKNLERAMERAVEHGGLGTEQEQRDRLLGQLGVLYNAEGLLDLRPASPWTAPAAPAAETVRPREDAASVRPPDAAGLNAVIPITASAAAHTTAVPDMAGRLRADAATPLPQPPASANGRGPEG
ncbi:hypothetical protein, partial [Actinocorallia longicatena]|uniref:hypothetical protein n=1 Tax=Actinocorallia longicatena TaxID=111803 RepID=UPI0031E1515E